jgi:trimeric autotransporter adhesin
MTRILSILLFSVCSVVFTFGQWQPVGSGTDLPVMALEADSAGSAVYAGGIFLNAGGSLTPGIAKWNGSSWSPLGSGVQAGTGIASLLFEGDTLYAGGTFTGIGGVLSKNIAKYDGAVWLPMDAGLEYTGATTVSTLRTFNNEVYAGGIFNGSGLTTVLSNIAKWSGGKWWDVAGGVNGPVYAMCVYNGELYVGGSFTSAGGVAVNNIAKWNGSNWSDVGGGVDDVVAPSVRSLAVYNGSLYAGGSFTIAGMTIPVKRVASWDGVSWSDPNGGVEYTGATTVSTLRTYQNKLIVGGIFDTAGVVAANFIAMYDGVNWSPMGAGMNNSVTSLTVLGDTLYAGGNFTQADNNTAMFAAQWFDAAAIITNNLSSSSAENAYLFPNPCKNICAVKVPANTKEFSVLFFDELGRNVLSRNKCSGAVFIDVHSLSSGVYTYKIIAANSEMIGLGKLVKE